MSIQEDFLDYIERWHLEHPDTPLTPDAMESLRVVYFCGAMSAVSIIAQAISQCNVLLEKPVLEAVVRLQRELAVYMRDLQT